MCECPCHGKRGLRQERNCVVCENNHTKKKIDWSKPIQWLRTKDPSVWDRATLVDKGPVYCVVKDREGTPYIVYTKDGTIKDLPGNPNIDWVVQNIPEPKEREYWVCIYLNRPLGISRVGQFSYPSEKEALDHKAYSPNEICLGAYQLEQ